jgi:hypothetical protein
MNTDKLQDVLMFSWAGLVCMGLFIAVLGATLIALVAVAVMAAIDIYDT